MRLIDNIAGVGFITVIIAGAGLALFNATGPDTHTGAGPPVLPDGLSPPAPPAVRALPAVNEFQPRVGTDDRRLHGRIDEYHQCYISGSVNGGTPFEFLVDSGSANLSFNRAHIRKLGLDPARLRYNQQTSTANGTGRAANIVVRELNLGGFVLHDVPAQIDYAGMDEPLLGMSILKDMQFEIGHDECALRW